MTSPGPEDVAEALRQGRPPSELLEGVDDDPSSGTGTSAPTAAAPPDPAVAAAPGPDVAAAPGTGPGAGPADPATTAS